MYSFFILRPQITKPDLSYENRPLSTGSIISVENDNNVSNYRVGVLLRSLLPAFQFYRINTRTIARISVDSLNTNSLPREYSTSIPSSRARFVTALPQQTSYTSFEITRNNRFLTNAILSLSFRQRSETDRELLTKNLLHLF